MKTWITLILLGISLQASGPVRVSAQPAAEERHPTLIAFSMEAARNILEAGHGDALEIQQVGSISKLWAVLLDENNDLIVVGERDPDTPPVLLEDIVVALRSKDKLDSDDNPGVSIEPLSMNRYRPTQTVKYFGNISRTNYGLICYKADLLLKHLSMGLLPSKIDGLPSEWELSMHKSKADYRTEPWMKSIGRSWFFPHKVRINHRNGTAALSSITMRVQTEFDGFVDISDHQLLLDTKTINDALKHNPAAVDVVYAKLLTEHYDDLADGYPVLQQLKNLLGLSGLLRAILKDDEMAGYDYWMDDYQLTPVDTPTSTPTVSRGVNGLGYTLFVSGGLTASYTYDDAWTDAVLSRKPKYLRQAVLRSRPSSSTVSWQIPLHLGRPSTWNEASLQQVAAAHASSLSKQQQHAERTQTLSSLQDGRTATHRSRGALSPGWRPHTRGKNLFTFSGHIDFSSGGFEVFSLNGQYSISGSNFSLGVPVRMQFIFGNRFGLDVTVPFVVRTKIEDRFSRSGLPGFSDVVTAYAGGIESPLVTNRVQLTSGMIKGRWVAPEIVLVNSLVVPISHQSFEGYDGPRVHQNTIDINFGSTDWQGSHGLQATLPLGNFSQFQAHGEYQTDWKTQSINERVFSSLNLHFTLNREYGFYLGLHYYNSLAKKPVLVDGAAVATWENDGRRLLTSFSNRTRHGANTLYLGYTLPRPDIETGNQFFFSLNLGGAAIWNWRAWF